MSNWRHWPRERGRACSPPYYKPKEPSINQGSTMRTYTNKLLEMIDNGEISAEAVVQMALSYMSEAEVQDMMEMNELLELNY
jgi:hypothetical protein